MNLIRPLTVEELPLCEPFGVAFHQEKAIPGEFSLQEFLKNWRLFLSSGIGVLYGLFRDGQLVGGIGGILTADVTTGTLVASELFWYVQPEDRHGTWPIRLVKTLREWGATKGATRFRMVHILMPNESPSTVKLAHVYRHLGLRPIEVAYDGPIGA